MVELIDTENVGRYSWFPDASLPCDILFGAMHHLTFGKTKPRDRHKSLDSCESRFRQHGGVRPAEVFEAIIAITLQ
jgi:hypothetical protein